MVPVPQPADRKECLCGQCHAPCGPEAHYCGHCHEPVCEQCLVVFSIRSRTHDGLVHQHRDCYQQSSAKDFRA